jgi:glycogen phosphorylase
VGRSVRARGRLAAWDGRDDASDAAEVYDVLEREVVPAFYDREAKRIPRKWVAHMRASMAALTPRYSAGRALREYTQGYYVPAARALAQRTAGGTGARIAEWKAQVKQHWSSLRFGEIRVSTDRGEHRFEVSAYLDDLDPDAVSVELYADGGAGSKPVRVAMRREAPLVGARGFVYVATVPVARPASNFTPRMVPCQADVAIPLELPAIVWAR